MKTFVKVFVSAFFAFLVAYSMGSIAYLNSNNLDIKENIGFGYYEKEKLADIMLNNMETPLGDEKIFKSLEDAKQNSSRVNFLILGMEDVRTDTILLASFNPDIKKMDIVSIPRDTYVHRKNYNGGEQRKINSVYLNHGVEGVSRTVSYLLDEIPIHHHIIIDYEGVQSIVDLMGGVEVDVPFDMKYKDPTANPPLNIDIKKGRQILDGKNALDFIRWRKGNDRSGYIDGDIGRINAQHQLLTSLSDKASKNIIPLLTKGFKHVKTDMKLLESIKFGRQLMGIDKEEIRFVTMPGKSDLRSINKKIYSYYIHNEKEVTELLEEIYNVKKVSE